MSSGKRFAVRRRGFLALMLGGAIAAADLLYPGIVRAASATVGRISPKLPPGSTLTIGGGPDQAFASGRVVAKSSYGFTLQSDASTRIVRAPANAVVWKEFDVTVADISLGDWVDVRGEAQPDGSLAARSGSIWVNIGRWEGVITAVGTSLDVQDRRSDAHKVIHFSKRIDVIHARPGFPAVVGGVKALNVGMNIGAVGINLRDGSLRATRVWIND